MGKHSELECSYCIMFLSQAQGDTLLTGQPIREAVLQLSTWELVEGGAAWHVARAGVRQYQRKNDSTPMHAASNHSQLKQWDPSLQRSHAGLGFG